MQHIHIICYTIDTRTQFDCSTRYLNRRRKKYNQPINLFVHLCTLSRSLYFKEKSFDSSFERIKCNSTNAFQIKWKRREKGFTLFQTTQTRGRSILYISALNKRPETFFGASIWTVVIRNSSVSFFSFLLCVKHSDSKIEFIVNYFRGQAHLYR